MRRLLCFLILLSGPYFMTAQEPVVRAHLEPAGNIMVGQPVRLIVSVFVPNYFSGSPEFPEFEIENAIVVLPQDRPENSNTQINGASYAGIAQTYVIYPQQTGDFRVPSARLSVPYAIAPPRSTTAHPLLPGLIFHAGVPAAAKDLPYFLPTTRLTITQKWSRPLRGLRTGDSVERIITVTAAKMQGMLIPPLPLDQPDGIRIYSTEPAVRDQKTARGDFIYGQRIQNAKYFIQKAGNYTLPAIELKWWNLATNRLAIATLPETKFTAAVHPDYVPELPPPAVEPVAMTRQKVSLWHRYRSTFRLGLEITVAVIGLTILFGLVHRIRVPLLYWWRQRKASEKALFRNLLHAARADDAKQAYPNLLRWLNVVLPGMSLNRQLGSLPLRPLRGLVDQLTAYLYGPSRSGIDSTAWRGSELASSLKKARAHLSTKREHSGNKLPPLNPV